MRSDGPYAVTDRGASTSAPTRGTGRQAVWIWAVLAAATLVPIVLAGTSPLLAWRDAIYIAAGFGGVISLSLLLLQPFLATGRLHGLTAIQARRVHRWVGMALLLAVAVHVGGLWLTSPPDVVDALMMRSPTPFSLWGVIALWALIAAALVVALRQRLARSFRLRPRIVRLVHAGLAAVTAIGTVIHALLIEGTMETITKAGLCALVLAALVKVAVDLRIWTLRIRPRP